MKFTLHIWRQPDSKSKGKMVRYEVEDISPDMSFLEMIDVLNEQLIVRGDQPVVFDHDCREGICGACSMVINGQAHGPMAKTTTCQLHMRSFEDGTDIVLEPWRSAAFPVIKDLMVDRTAFDRIIQAGGYVSVGTGGVPDANAIPVGKETSDLAMDAAECISCGACVAACPNGSAMLFTAAKVSHLALLPQGQVERSERARNMVAAMDAEPFGACTNYGECQEACPKDISIAFIGRMNKDYIKASICDEEDARDPVRAQ